MRWVKEEKTHVLNPANHAKRVTSQRDFPRESREARASVVSQGDSEWSRAELGMPCAQAGKLRGDL
jgi:hypothetical protein